MARKTFFFLPSGTKLPPSTPVVSQQQPAQPPARSEKVIFVMTSKTLDQILSEGGTGPWAIDHKLARKFRYAVCAHKAPRTKDNGKAFVVGRIKNVITSPENHERWLISFSEYALISIPNAWKGWRNPLKYINLQEIGIDLNSLDFKPIPLKEPSDKQLSSFYDGAKLTLDQAKQGLANNFGVPIEAIEITIKM